MSEPLSALERIHASRRQMGRDAAELLPHEKRWRDRQPLLASHGYNLRPRFHPDWVPSWDADPTINPVTCEDYVQLPFLPNIIDARRVSDGRLVCIKYVKAEELEIAKIFSSKELRDDPRNHCIPVLDSFQDHADKRFAYMVMPFVRAMANPPFELVNDIIVFADQVLEGLAFIHANNVAHRDCAGSNIFMNADALYPRGFHPVLKDKLPNIKHYAWPYSRFSAPGPVEYYIADFDISMHIPPGKPRKAIGEIGADRDVPELSDTVPYDPFKVDIFTLGNIFRRHIHDKYFRVHFLAPLILAMTNEDPEARPTAQGALDQWRNIRRRVLLLHRLRRLRGREEILLVALILDTITMLKLAYILARRLSGWCIEWLSFVC